MARHISPKKRNSGMSLIEVLVAIFIIAVGMVGIMAFHNMNINSQFEARRELAAANLAQECLEIVKNIRDFNKLASVSNWYNGINSSANCPFVDYESIITHTCKTSSNAKAEVCKDAQGRYKQCQPLESENTGFLRSLNYSDTSASGYLDIKCTVSWDTGAKKAEATDRLYEPNWQ